MTRIARDSVTASDVPIDGAVLFGGYTNGKYAWSAEDWKRFPANTTYSIDVLGTDYTADELDVEAGNPTDGPSFKVTINWVKNYKGRSKPILYANESTLTPMFNSLNAVGLYVQKDFLLHIATLDGKTSRVNDMTGVVAVQWKGPAQTGGHYDESIVYDDNWLRAAPVTPPVTTESGLLVMSNLSSKVVKSTDGGKTWQ